MMAHPPAIDFEFFSPGSSHAVDHAIQLAALRKEADRRKRSNAIKVERQDMRSDKAEVDAALFKELIADFADRHAGIAPDRVPVFQWAQKLNALRGEIMRRRRSYPSLVEQGRMAEADAIAGIATFECAHRWYWIEGLGFGSEMLVAGDVQRSYARFREEHARRAAWARRGPRERAEDELEIKVDRHAARAFGRPPFRVGFARLPEAPALWQAFTILDADDEEPLFGPDVRIRPLLDALEPNARTHTLLAIARELNAAAENAAKEERQAA